MWKIYKNTGFMIWSGGMRIINSLLVWALVARYLGQAAFGHFTLIMAVYLIFFDLCSLGLGPLIVREVTGGRADQGRFITSTALVLAGAGILSSGIMTVTGLMLGLDPTILVPLALLSLSLPATALITECESLLIAREQPSTIAAVTTSENLLKALIPWFLVSLGFGLSAMCATFVVLRCGTLITYTIKLGRRVPLGWPTRASVRYVLRQVPWFVLISLSSGLHWQVGIILLSKFRGATDAATYGAASRLLVPWTLVCVSYAASVNPKLCRLATQSVARMGRFCRQGISDVLLLLLPLVAGTWLLAEPVLGFIFGPGYGASVAPLRVVIWSLVPLGLVLLLARSLIAVHRQKVDFWSNAVALAANVGLNLWLIPRYGAVGVAVAQLISVTLLFVIQLAYVSWFLFRVRLASLTGRFVLATCGMAMLVSLVEARMVWLIVPLGVVSYFGCLLILGWRPALKT